MGLATESFNADGSTKVFSIGAEILSESHIRVHFTYDGIDHAIPSSEWDVLSSAVIFDTAPTNGYVVKITISSDGQGLDDAPTDISNIAENITTIVNIENNLPALNSLNDNLAEVLQAEGNASTATAQAIIATEQATIATNKAGEALVSANNASTSESNASTSETNASNSANTATTQAGIATTKANEASTSASNASASEANALAYANSINPTAIEASINANTEAIANVKTTPINLSTILKGSFSLSNTIKSSIFDGFLYTGNGTSQNIITGINSVDFATVGNGSGYHIVRNGITDFDVYEESLSSNQITNGTFDTDTGWSKSSSWSIQNGVAINNGTETNGLLYQNINAVVGEVWEVTFDITSYTSGVVYPLLSDIIARAGVGTYRIVSTISPSFLNLAYMRGVSFIGEIDNVVWKKISSTLSVEGECNWLAYDSTSGETPRGISKVHVKERDGTAYNLVYDGLRGGLNYISTNNILAETTSAEGITSFNNDGFTISDASGLGVNRSPYNYIAYQTLYTHIKWGVTNGVKWIVAYNPVTNQGIRLREGSDNIISLWCPFLTKYSETKRLNSTDGGLVFYGDKDSYMQLYSTSGNSARTTGVSNWGASEPTEETFTFGGNYASTNQSGGLYIDYFNGASEVWNNGIYQGTGVAGTKIITKDANGVARKPMRVKIKRLDVANDYLVFDNKRAGLLRLNTSETEGGDLIDIISDGFIIQDASDKSNALNGEYYFEAYFDTDADGGGSETDLPSLNTQLQVSSAVGSISNGIGSNGADNTIFTLDGTLTPSGGYV